ncbi:Murein DD-endopeptidase MepM and murein hydrolase activator NlpD, contain LysM domain [Anaerobium acetethylicum]|uniref:Murein DD-endopeptidase MepM and murein hydrolase activator NlpD, contain LysM domain n=2 Tax=Anaerobium acetethylicum TaxID=1619234 RepID=A0A1D3TYB1_9FIRM|nr:Murein DD-endopeptidase MepM and murein hydrolase activator NlpD, contain LysM domain [Anaerobium acetethylicum]
MHSEPEPPAGFNHGGFMKRVTRHYQKAQRGFVKAAILAGLFFLVAAPVAGNAGNDGKGYYTVSVNDKEIGSVSSEEMADEAYIEARAKLQGESEDLVLVDAEVKVTEAENRLFGSTDTKEEVADRIYDELKNKIVDAKRKAYTVKIDQFSVTLGSRDEVVQLLDAAKSKYDTGNRFSVELVADESNEMDVLTANVVTAGVSSNGAASVMAAEDGTAQPAAQEAAVESNNGIMNIAFEENVEIVETYATSEQMTPVADAIDMVTKDKETNKVYEVVEGDCLSTVAEKNATSVANILGMNPSMTEETVIQIGDEIVVTVPEPELSVVVTEEATYEEDYQAETQYVDNNSWYTSQQAVVQEASPGRRQITAVITYRNGSEVGREIRQETVIAESLPQIIERGTQAPPTFIKPVSSGSFSSPFGPRWGKMHKGVDWSCSTGTAVKASCGGTVSSAGWQNGYGNCITITHSNGMQTRYAHLSKIMVSVGARVSQGDKIALSGNTGRSTGPHLHFEIIVNGTQVDPMKYLK